MADEELLYFNGINGATGDYETMPLPLDKLAQIAKGESLDEQDLKELQQKHAQKTEGHWAVKEGVDPKDLSQTGWGVIFAFSDKDKTPAVREALSELLEHRKAKAGQYYKEYTGPDAYRPKEGKNEFLARHGAGPGPADPAKVPYYLLIVGDPEAIPYKVQYQLDVQYAVGRVHFDTLEEYAAYARAVVTAEKSKPFLPRTAAFFGVSNPDDRATNLSAESLIKPLSANMVKDKPDWSVNVVAPADSTKTRLSQMLSGGADTPALLFTASHGMGFPNGDERQLRHQGALLCQDWPGPQKWRQPIQEDFYFSADDLSSSANLLGLMAFYFACYGAGTPKLDEFAHKTGQRAQIAPHAFMARLPRKLLTQGALAAVGHVERAWGTSFLWDKAGVQLAVFESSFKRLMEGHPIGSAFEFFNERYAEISSDLSSQLEEIQFGAEVDNAKIVGMWTANNDARSYVIVGDPAARMPVVESGGAPPGRPSLGAVSLPKVKPGDQAPAIPAAPAAPFPPAPASDEAVDYGIKESLDQVKTKVNALVHQLVDTLKQVVDDVTSLEVKTYLSDDLSAVQYQRETREFSNAQLRAMTRINLDGDVLNVVPESAGELDQALWQVHLSMVEQAQNSRAKMLETAVGLLGSLKGL
jgi:hypothetical protein